METGRRSEISIRDPALTLVGVLRVYLPVHQCWHSYWSNCDDVRMEGMSYQVCMYTSSNHFLLCQMVFNTGRSRNILPPPAGFALPTPYLWKYAADGRWCRNLVTTWWKPTETDDSRENTKIDIQPTRQQPHDSGSHNANTCNDLLPDLDRFALVVFFPVI
ncbi:hypothetical protein BD779DRAFT_283800 [Infundibulicybe gibba]|nr:hypothetical protein BD779DRAFT_283800 [Infundibulicybe gibba]